MPACPASDPDRWTTMEADLHAWWRAHPDATWVEIETELDRRLDVLRAAVLGEVVVDTPDGAMPCPACGGRLVGRGRRTRTLLTDGDVEVPLSRPYATCRTCGTGLFPLR